MRNDTTPITTAYRHADMDDSAPCRKCEATISATADRCPACGYDPTPGALGTIVFLLALPFAGIGALLAVTSIVGAATALLTVGEAVGALVATAVVFGLPMWYVARHVSRKRMGAAER